MPDDTQAGLIEAVIEARALVQELHGQIKDASRARRELAQAQAQVGRVAEEAARRVAEEHAAKLEATMLAWAQDVKVVIAEVNANLHERAAELAGLKTPDEFMTMILEGLKETLVSRVNERAELIARQLEKRRRQ